MIRAEREGAVLSARNSGLFVKLRAISSIPMKTSVISNLIPVGIVEFEVWVEDSALLRQLGVAAVLFEKVKELQAWQFELMSLLTYVNTKELLK